MEMAETLNIYHKLNNFRTSVETIRKDKKGYNYKYADINEVIKIITEPLSNNGLIDVDTTYKDENGQLWLETKLINIDKPEEFLKIETPLLLKNPNDPQALGSAITYCRRYNRVTLLGLEQEDDDGNAAKSGPQKKEVDPRLQAAKDKLKSRLKAKGIIDTQHQKGFAEFVKTKGYDIFTNINHIEQLANNDALLNNLTSQFLGNKTVA